MSNSIPIPPLLSNTPPPPPTPEDDDDDEFGDFIGTNDPFCGCESLSLPTSPEHSPKEVSISAELDSIENMGSMRVCSEKTEKFDCANWIPEYKEIGVLNVNKFSLKQDISPREIRKEGSSLINSNFVEACYLDNSIATDKEIVPYISEYSDPLFVQQKECGDQFSNYLVTSNDFGEVLVEDTTMVDIEEHLTQQIDLGHGKDNQISDCCFSSETTHDFENIDNNLSTSSNQSFINSDNISLKDTIPEVSTSVGMDSENDAPNKNFTFSMDQERFHSSFTPFTEKNVGSTIKDSLHNKDSLCSNNEDNSNMEFNDLSDLPSCQPIDNGPKPKGDVSNLNKEDKKCEEVLEDDEFGEFTSTCETSLPSIEEFEFSKNQSFLELLTEDEAFVKTKQFFEDAFPFPEMCYEDCKYAEIEKDSDIFSLLKDITNTPALSHQWDKSAGQKLLLHSLSIDERNILPPWNTSMPLFAHSLSLQPLEPVKTENQYVSHTNVTSTTKHFSEEIPSAQFDWKGSGLQNPLDGSSQDSKKGDLRTESPKTFQKELSMQIPDKMDVHVQNNASLDELTNVSNESSRNHQRNSEWTNITPLRETHISYSNSTDSGGDKSYNILNQDWINMSSGFSQFDITNKGAELIDNNKENVQVRDVGDKEEFKDFQMAQSTSVAQSQGSIQAKLMEHLHETSTISNTHILEDSKIYTDISNIKRITGETSQPLTNDDEFTDFQSSAPIFQEAKYSTLMHAAKPLKPTPVYQNMSSCTQIEWPDPGITDEEIQKIEDVFCKPSPSKDMSIKKFEGIPAKLMNPQKIDMLPVNQLISNLPNSNISKINELETKKPKTTHSKATHSRVAELNNSQNMSIRTLAKQKDTTLDSNKQHINKNNLEAQTSEEDEWSDFVSAQKLSPVRKLTSTERQGTSTSPDLPLSVFNLGSIHPAKHPIPVITPRGLVQTKLLTNMSPKAEVKVNKTSLQSVFTSPSTISSQFASDAYTFNSKKAGSTSSQVNHDDEEWSEFVSSPLPQSTVNGYRSEQNWMQNRNWMNFSPNIITNPGHYVQSASAISKRVSNVNSVSKKSVAPPLTLPDLDFIAPRSRTSVSKKK